MGDFKKTLDNTEFHFRGAKERDEQIFWVTGDSQSFKMTTDEDGNWGIWQQVPRWIKEIEEDLANAIEEQMEKKQS